MAAVIKYDNTCFIDQAGQKVSDITEYNLHWDLFK